MSVGLTRGFMRRRSAKTAKRIEILFRMKNLGDRKHIVLDVVPIPQRRGMGMRYITTIGDIMVSTFV